MQRTAQLIAALGLALTIVPSLLYFANQIDHSAVLFTGLVGTAIWFIATPVCMAKK